jgi:hypothetical protein
MHPKMEFLHRESESEHSRYFYLATLIPLGTEFFVYLWGWSETESTMTAAIYWPIVPAMDDGW